MPGDPENPFDRFITGLVYFLLIVAAILIISVLIAQGIILIKE